ncbi:MAG TPA: DUF3488 and transglutaminase-like domain-containing protein [Methylibium sp.]|uniref:transglutaminase family protein n=1 Tax=Methylibium sp. TaxID=2067992 RepID=UPI002DC020CB|nr:DUF3488 and transglutaminase-like domain-containing protein [Methylibium sp.]HEU4459075.1 DUF3488 and transglutaminase-like domain-containing protein [Methylibium sp.]
MRVEGRTRWAAAWLRWPRETRDTLFLLAVIAWTVLPHLPRLPAWCSLMTAGVLAWRARLAVKGGALPNRWWLALMLVTALALTLFSHRTVLGKEAGVTLLVVLVALKTLELRARRDALAVFFLGFFLVLTHFLQSQSLAIAAAMLVSVWGLLTALVLAHMPVGQPSLGRAAALAARFAVFGAPVMVALFMLFPRFGPLWGVPGDSGAKTGLSGTMELGQFGLLANDDTIAMRLRIVAGAIPRPEQLYFRGPVLDHFDGRSWTMQPSSFPRALRARAELRMLGAPVELEVTVEPLKLATLPTLEATPELPAIEGQTPSLRDDLHWTLPRPLSERVVYTARAWPAFRHGPGTPVVGLQDFLQLPANRNPRTLQWAADLRREPRYAEADATTLAAAVMRHIGSAGFGYTLTPGVYGEDERGHLIDEFWLDRKLGYCEHFAAAFVVVMRALDVPARIVTGYQGAERNPIDGALVVRQSHAHAWAEYWQPGEGWLRADPTAAVAPDRINLSRPLRPSPGFIGAAFEGVAPDALVRLRDLWEATNHRWNQWVLNYGRASQVELLKRLGFEAPGIGELGVVLGMLVAAASLVGAAWAWREQHRLDPWLRAYARVRRAAARRGFEADATVPPRRLANQLAAHGGEHARAAIEALHALEALRYANAAPLDEPGSSLRARWARRSAARALASRAVAALKLG